MEVAQIEITRISEDPNQPRKHYSEESLQGLADSIRQHGMLNPVTVTPLSENRYQLVTGERRWRAAEMAHVAAIPCIVKQINAEERLTEQLIENLQREDLQPIEKARAVQHVRTTLNLTNREIARRLGLSERTIGYLLDLLALPENISETIVSSPNRPADGQVTEKHARFLKQLNEDPTLQSAVVDRIRDDKLSSEDTGNLVKALKKRPDRTDEIMSSPTDHLVRFFQDDDEGLETDDQSSERPQLSQRAKRIVDLVPSVSGIDLANCAMPELRQIEDALTSLKLAVEGMLRSCKQRLGESS